MKQSEKTLYEVTVVTPAAGEGVKVEGVLEAVEKLFSKLSIDMVSDESWGEKSFAYLLKKHDKGNFHHYRINAAHEASLELNQQIKHIPGMLRWLIVLADKEKVAPTKAS